MKHRSGSRCNRVPVALHACMEGMLPRQIRISPAVFLFAMALRMTVASPATEVSLSFKGVEDDALLKDLRGASRLTALEGAASAFVMSRQANRDVPRLMEILRAHAYYGAAVTASVTHEAEANKIRVQYQVTPGPVYTIEDVVLHFEPDDSGTREGMPSVAGLDLNPGGRASASAIRAARQSLIRKMRRNGCIFAQVDDPRVYVDRAAGGVKVAFVCRPGPSATYGPLKIQGLNSVSDAVIRRRIPWSAGDRVNAEQFRQLRRELLETELFSTVQIQYPEEVDPDGRLPVTVMVTEASHRVLTFAVGYETDVGPRVATSWKHRNLLGEAERLQFSLQLSPLKQQARLRFEKPAFLEADQTLNMSTAVTHEDTDAYESLAVESSVAVDRSLTDDMLLGVGTTYKGSRIDDVQGTEVFHLLSLPVTLDIDRRDDLLDPQKGWRLSLHYEPFKEVFSGDLLFYKGILNARCYLDLLPDTVLALRGRCGVMLGEETEDIPADERFYAGGGGSIRGYPYQEVGPHRDGEPFGGRSLLEMAAEIRWRWTEQIGWVVFIDGGNVYDDTFPDPGRKLFWGAGAGVRYYSPMGPLRLDVAVPLNPDDSIGASFQLYISLGQAF